MSLRRQLVYPLPDPKNFYESLFSKDGKIFERNTVKTRPTYLSPEPGAKTCSLECSSKDVVFVVDSIVDGEEHGEYVCRNDGCKNCGTVVKEIVFERERTRSEEALEMDIEEKQTGNL